MGPNFEYRFLRFVLAFLWWWGTACPCMGSVFSPRYAPIATTKYGQLRGSVAYSRNNAVYYQYMGIPYALPPVGDLRFEAPIQWNQSWEGVRSADDWGPPCLQYDAILRGRVLGEEDCLFLNIFTKELKPVKLFPVLAWIHGGGFVAGSSDMYDPKYIMDHDVVVVSFNYRLASLGFLNTGDELIRGNMGLKDQNLALRFIQENIRNFGGDPDQVTLFGESAGAASVHYHIISPLSKGLFHRAIMQSGNVYCPWALTRSPMNQAMGFGRNIGCPTDNTSVLVRCLKKMQGRDIVFEHHKILSPVHTQDDFFPGSVEAVKRNDTFLGENPFIMIERGDFNRVPVIFGMNSGEGALKTARLEATPEVMNAMDYDWHKHVAVLLHYNPELTNISDKIRHYYCPLSIIIPELREGIDYERIPPQNALENVTDMISDGVWYHATKAAAVHHAKFAPVYLNYFSYHSRVLPSAYTFIKSARRRDNVPAEFSWPRYFAESYIHQLFFQDRDPKRFGACHGDDLMYYWSTNPILQIRTWSQDYNFSKNFVNSIVQFTQHEPLLSFAGERWDPVNPNETLRYMKLDKNAEMIEQPFQNRLDFIESLGIRNPLDPNNW